MKRSPRKLKRMVRFFREYPGSFEFGQPPVAQLPAGAFLQQLAANLPWYHRVILMEKVKDLSVHLWYLQQTIEQRWTRA